MTKDLNAIPIRGSTGSRPATIELRLHEISQLFNSMDPSPFREKGLDAGAEEFITDWAEELPKNLPLELVIHLSSPPVQERGEAAVGEAVRNHFEYRAEQTAARNRQLLRQGWKNLVIGLLFLSVCLFAAQWIDRHLQGTLTSILRESLLIGGWVAMWRPMETFLYDRWPGNRRLKLYTRLGQMRVRLSLP